MSEDKEGVVKTKDKNRYMAEGKAINSDLIEEIKRSRKLGWAAATCGFVLACGGLVAASVAFNRPLPDPVVYMADKTTGAIERIGTLTDYQISQEQATNEHYIARYVNSREGYNYSIIQTMYDNTVLLSAPNDVQRSYAAIYQGDNARDKEWGSHKRRTVSIRSIQNTVPGEQATVRFSTQIIPDNGPAQERRYWVATLGYEYVGEPMSVEDRWRNPKGFQVTAYRVDPEVVGQ